MTFFGWFIFIPLQIIWLPFSILGVLWLAHKQIGRSKALGLSQTAIEVINGRWTGHVLGLRKDLASYRLAGKLPNNSVLGLGVALLPLLVARLLAGRPFLHFLLPDDDRSGLANIVLSRSRRFDELIASHASSVAQLVVLGAGLDTRAYGPLAGARMAMFELDTSAMQRSKQAALKRAKLAVDHVHFVEVNFSDANWIEALIASPYDPSLKTIFLWEGVTLYLTEAEVRDTLAAIKANAAPGSIVALDLYGRRLLDIGKKGAGAKALEATGERFQFGLDFAVDPEAMLSTFAASVGFRLGSHYFLGASHKSGPYMVVAELRL
jgi:methyltransferase (TIGR00027 family)